LDLQIHKPYIESLSCLSPRTSILTIFIFKRNVLLKTTVEKAINLKKVLLFSFFKQNITKSKQEE